MTIPLAPESITAPALQAMPGIAHGFFTRRGGVSDGLYASLNCGPGSADKPENVAENRRRVAAALGATALASLYQVHGRDVITVDEGYDAGTRPKADGMVSRQRGVALGILSADCTPVLFADSEAGVVGACHAGWRGALAGITDATLQAMLALGADRSRIRAAIGPTIRQASYEVSEPFRSEFTAADATNQDFFGPGKRPGHWQFDLPGYLARRLERAGVAFADLGHDTLSDSDRFFSYRRITLAGEPDYGRQISAIALR